MYIYDISHYFGPAPIVSQVIWYLICFTYIYNLYFCWLQYHNFASNKKKIPTTKQTHKQKNHQRLKIMLFRSIITEGPWDDFQCFKF